MSFAVGKNTAAYSRLWHLVDARGQILGHLARGIASTLTGEIKPIYSRHEDIGDHIVLINAKDITVSGDKLSKKLYYHHTGYPGGIRADNLKSMLQNRPEDVIRDAVYGMLPKDKLRKQRIERLHIFLDNKHPYDRNLVKFYEDPDMESISSRFIYDMNPKDLAEWYDKHQLTKLQQLIENQK